MNSLAVSVCMMLMSGSFSGPPAPAQPNMAPVKSPATSPALVAERDVESASKPEGSQKSLEPAASDQMSPARLRVADLSGAVTGSRRSYADYTSRVLRAPGLLDDSPADGALFDGRPDSSATYPAALVEEEIEFVELTNRERALVGLKPLEVDRTLVEAARAHSREMYDKFYFAHESPTGSLRTPMKRYLKALNYRPRYAMIGENIAYCSEVNVGVSHNALMNSEGHRANILDPRYDAIGIGVCKGADGSFYVTEMFLGRSPR